MLRILFRLLLILCAGHVYAASTTFKIGVEDIDYYPHYAVRQGQYVGYARDLLDAFAAHNGYQFEYVILPVKRLYSAFLVDRSVDFKFPDNPHWTPDQRAGIPVYYSSSVINVTEGLMVLPENEGRSLSSVKDIGTILGFTAWPYLAEVNRGAIKVHENPNFEGLLRQVLSGRVDGAYINIEVANNLIGDKLKMTGRLVFDPNLPYASSTFSLSTIQHPDIIEQFNDFLIKESALQAQLRDKYGMKAPPPAN